MERLTERSLDYCTQMCPDEKMFSCAFYKDDQAERCLIANMYDRLAAYEDTGLTPEEINGNIISREYAPLHHWFWVELHQRPERLKKIFDAEQEGRLIVLPCKTDTIWIVEEATHDCDTVPDKDCMARPNCEGCPALKSYVRRIDTFYFTRAEAEKAMEVRE